MDDHVHYSHADGRDIVLLSVHADIGALSGCGAGTQQQRAAAARGVVGVDIRASVLVYADELGHEDAHLCRRVKLSLRLARL